MTKDSIQYGATLIEYDIEFVDRKTLGIKVLPNGTVSLKAPINATLDDIRNKVHHRAAWILRQMILEVVCQNKKEAGRVLQLWYLERAQIKFPEYAKPIIEQFAAYGVQPKSVGIRKMEKRWGYCTTDGNIYLNPRLICAPRCCIEYVITHELCHLVHHNHNKEFYALLSKEMPHWEKWKTKLERIMI